MKKIEWLLTYGSSGSGGIKVVTFTSLVEACVVAGRFDRSIPVDIFAHLVS